MIEYLQILGQEVYKIIFLLNSYISFCSYDRLVR